MSHLSITGFITESTCALAQLSSIIKKIYAYGKVAWFYLLGNWAAGAELDAGSLLLLCWSCELHAQACVTQYTQTAPACKCVLKAQCPVAVCCLQFAVVLLFNLLLCQVDGQLEVACACAAPAPSRSIPAAAHRQAAAAVGRPARGKWGPGNVGLY